MNRHVVSALHERRIDREEWFHPLRGETAREERRVFFRNSNIEIARRMFRLENPSPVPLGIARGNGDDLLICVRKSRERLADDLGIGRRRRRRGFTTLDLDIFRDREICPAS